MRPSPIVLTQIRDVFSETGSWISWGALPEDPLNIDQSKSQVSGNDDHRDKQLAWKRRRSRDGNGLLEGLALPDESSLVVFSDERGIGR